jgi:hypothetical protein
MDIGSLSSSAQTGTPSQNPSASISQFKAQQSGQLLSLIPAPASMPGLGLNLDIYAAVGMQSQGYLSGGLMSIELANISLGIDMSKLSPAASAAGTDAGGASSATAPATTTPGTAAPASHTNTVLNDILKADGYVAPAENTYAVQTDFFADSDSPAPASAPAYYANPSLSNPGLGGLINSLG